MDTASPLDYWIRLRLLDFWSASAWIVGHAALWIFGFGFACWIVGAQALGLLDFWKR